MSSYQRLHTPKEHIDSITTRSNTPIDDALRDIRIIQQNSNSTHNSNSSTPFKSSSNSDSDSDSSSEHHFSLRRLFGQTVPERNLLIFATFCLFIGQLLFLTVPAFVGAVLDSLTNPSHGNKSTVLYFIQSLGFGNDPRSVLNVACILLLIIIAISAVFSGVRGYLFTKAGERVVARLRRRLFDHILQQEIAFFDQTRTAELISRLSADLTILKDASTINVSMGLRFSSTVVLGIVYLFFISYKLTLLMLAVVPFVALGSRSYGTRIRNLSKQTQDALAQATETAEESIAHIRTVRSFSREPTQSTLYADAIDVTYELGVKMAKFYGGFVASITFMATTAMIIVLYYGSLLVLNGEITTGTLSSYVLYTLTIATSLAGLSSVFAQFLQAVGAGERCFALLDRIPSVKSGSLIPVNFTGKVELNNVTFHYPQRPDITVLKDLSITLNPASFTALVGISGAGKSSIALLIDRLYDLEPSANDQGQILIDGRSIREYSLPWLHKHIVLISQEPAIFAMTIRENICYGVDNVTEQQLLQACEMANCKQFIEALPEKYETKLGERGINLSGGQRARIAISRAFLMNPRVLLCDEFSAALDSESEHHVQQALDRLMKGRTVLVVAHRLATVKNADIVIVIHQGKSIERGTHTQLIAKNGMYAKLVARQLLGAEVRLVEDMQNHNSHTNGNGENISDIE